MRQVSWVGHRFGRLIALEKVYRKGRNRTYYVCQCDCGKIVQVGYSNLKNGNTKSCGCFRVDACRARERKKNHPTHGVVLAYYKRNAKVRNLSWNLSVEEFSSLIRGNCYYCGTSPKARVLIGKRIEFNGIDRRNNSLGYQKDNVLSCCTWCNYAKNSRSQEDFIKWVKQIYTHLKEVHDV